MLGDKPPYYPQDPPTPVIQRVFQIKSPIGHSDWYDLARGVGLAALIGALGFLAHYLPTLHTDNTAIASGLALLTVILNDIISKVNPGKQS